MTLEELRTSVDALKKEEQELLARTVRKYGEPSGDCAEVRFFDYPVVACYSFDEPDDVYILSVKVSRHGTIEMEGEDRNCIKIPVYPENVFPGQLGNVVQRITEENYMI